MKYGLQGKFKAVSGKGKELAAILQQASELMMALDTCHAYIVGIDKKDHDIIRITEVWDDKKAHDESLNTPGVRELIGQAMPLLAEAPVGGIETDVLGDY